MLCAIHEQSEVKVQQIKESGGTSIDVWVVGSDSLWVEAVNLSFFSFAVTLQKQKHGSSVKTGVVSVNCPL